MEEYLPELIVWALKLPEFDHFYQQSVSSSSTSPTGLSIPEANDIWDEDLEKQHINKTIEHFYITILEMLSKNKSNWPNNNDWQIK